MSDDPRLAPSRLPGDSGYHAEYYAWCRKHELRFQRCTGCGWCIAVCPPHVLSLQVQGTGPWGPKCSTLHDAPGCTGCALCAVRCPFDAIRMVRVAATEGR